MTAPAPTPAAADPLLLAALLGVFDPRALPGVAGGTDSAALAALADLSEERAHGMGWLWSLLPAARREALARIPPPGPQRRALLAAAPPRTDDPLGQALHEALADRPGPALAAFLRRPARPAPETLTTDLLVALHQAIQLLASAGTALPPWAAAEGVLRALQRAVVTRRDAAESIVLIGGTFRGRQREMALLTAFARTGRIAAPARGTAAVTGTAESGLIPAVIVTGIGGVGKSALLEALRRRLAQETGLIAVHFDLDQPALRAGERVALTLDLLRQVALADPALDPPVAALRAAVRATADAAFATGGGIEAGGSAVLSAAGGLARALADAGRADTAIVVLFDTFEEVLVAGAERVRYLADWLATLAGQIGPGRLRVVIAGRAAENVTGMALSGIAFAGQVALGDLGTRAGRSKLRDRFAEHGIPHDDLVAGLIGAFGSNALVIEILARFCRDRDRADIQALIADTDPALRRGLGAEMRQRFLYSRILERIADPDLRRLANPGLVLRRITPRIIAEVLAGPCGLATPMPAARAEALFDALARQVWLVQPAAVAGRELIHIPDLRRMMLPQILQDDSARAVALAAADWYAARDREGDTSAAWEVLYYRALVDPASLPEDDDTLRTLADRLGAATLDLGAVAQARLRAAAGRILRPEEIALLSGEAQVKARLHRQVFQKSEGLESAIVEEAASYAQEAAEAAGAGPGVQAGAQAGVQAGVPAGVPAGEPLLAVEEVPAPLSTTPEATAAPQPLPDPDMVRARFAAGAFAELAGLAPLLAEDLMRSIAASVSPPPSGSALDHPAYLAALATLIHGSASRKYLARAFRPGGDSGWTRDQIAEASHRAWPALPPGDGPVAAAILAAGFAGLPPSALLGRGAAGTTAAALLLRPKPAASPADWRMALVLPSPDGTCPARLGALPALHPALVAALAGPAGAGWIVADDPAVAEALRLLPAPEGPLGLADLARIAEACARAVVALRPAGVPEADRAALLPGRLVEFHAPLRLLLSPQAPIAGLVAAVADLAQAVPWWPTELDPAIFAGVPNTTHVSALIDLADRCGMLGRLAAGLARAPGAEPGVVALDRLIAAFTLNILGRYPPA